MRYGLIISLFVLFGIGEYAFVEYYPLEPYRRVQKFERLPVVKQIVVAKEKALVEKAFASDDDGILSVGIGKTTKVWRSVEQWSQDRKTGDRWASSLADRLKFQAQAKASFTAEGGFKLPVHPMDHLGYYMAATSLGDAKITNDVLERWRSDTTATARWTYKMYFEKSLNIESKEGMLLTAQASIENMRHPRISKQWFEQQTQQNQNTLDTIVERADSGNEAARWVLSQLNTRQVNNSGLQN